jgi:hypothetical protein
MNNDYEKWLEREVDRELKGLPELNAPAGISSRVLQAIAGRSRLPWYRQSWPAWPPALRFASLALLVAMFGGLCFAGWRVSQLETFANGVGRVGNLFGSMSAIWSAVHVLTSTLALLLKQLGTGLMVGCLILIFAGYALCLGLGTVSFRMAFARR